ncbi:MAG: aminotransferase class V-fold PLP-dependent enzyme [Paracoccaceae bacterium]|nr:aminotransferase class V-fold PLP-dependent enzyme [Paracoccaceae bacterium]
MSERVYLDWNATAPLREEARAAMIAAMDVVGNPSSVHAEGRAAKGVVEKARAQVADAVGCKPAEVVFTSGATEAASVLSRLDANVVVEPTAHDALWSHKGENRQSTRLVAAQGLGNSETGVILDLPEKRDDRWVMADGAMADLLLLDVTQAIGRVPFSFAWSGVDFAVLSAHKLGGPIGVGALIVKEGTQIGPLASGGGQEMGRRAGTEAVTAIAGFGAAAEAAVGALAEGAWGAVERLRDLWESKVAESAPEAICIGRDNRRLPNTSCVAVPGWKGETQVMQMDLAGYSISAGSACSSGKVRASRVLQAMGYDDMTSACAIRVSLGVETKEQEVLQFAETWAAAHKRFLARAA